MSSSTSTKPVRVRRVWPIEDDRKFLALGFTAPLTVPASIATPSDSAYKLCPYVNRCQASRVPSQFYEVCCGRNYENCKEVEVNLKGEARNG